MLGAWKMCWSGRYAGWKMGWVEDLPGGRSAGVEDLPGGRCSGGRKAGVEENLGGRSVSAVNRYVVHTMYTSTYVCYMPTFLVLICK